MNYLFFSVDLKLLGDRINMQSQAEVEEIMADKQIPFQIVTGQYEGVAENSYMLHWSDENEAFVKDMCKQFNQHSYAVTGKNRWFGIYTPDGKCAHNSVYTIQDSKPLNDYTLLPDGRYLTT